MLTEDASNEDVLPEDATSDQNHVSSLGDSLGDSNMSNGDGQQPVTSALKSETQPESSPEAPVEAPGKKLCGICKVTASKYKCSRCEIPYCSIVCNTIHQANHPPTEPKQSPPKPEELSIASNQISNVVTAPTTGSSNPFAALDDAPELKELFKIYPRLPQQLLDIEAATGISITNGHHESKYRNGGRGSDPKHGITNGVLNQDPGLQRGLMALYTARRSDDGEAVLEYGKLILQILARDITIDAPTLIHQDVEKESAQLVALLLQAEKNS